MQNSHELVGSKDQECQAKQEIKMMMIKIKLRIMDENFHGIIERKDLL